MGNNNHDVDIANDFLTYKVWEKRRWLKRAKILLFFVLVVSGLTFMYVRAYTQKKAFVENQFAGAVFSGLSGSVGPSGGSGLYRNGNQG